MVRADAGAVVTPSTAHPVAPWEARQGVRAPGAAAARARRVAAVVDAGREVMVAV